MAKMPSEDKIIEISAKRDSALVWAYSPAYTFL